MGDVGEGEWGRSRKRLCGAGSVRSRETLAWRAEEPGDWGKPALIYVRRRIEGLDSVICFTNYQRAILLRRAAQENCFCRCTTKTSFFIAQSNACPPRNVPSSRWETRAAVSALHKEVRHGLCHANGMLISGSVARKYQSALVFDLFQRLWPGPSFFLSIQ